MDIEQLKRVVADNQIKYILAQFVDIHGVAKAKAVPAAHLGDILGDGAGFAGFAVDGLGIPPQGPDFMGIGDPRSFRLVPWQRGVARLACSGHVGGKPHPLDSRVICQKMLDRVREKTGYSLLTGLEPEFFLLKKDPASGAILPASDSDQLNKPCYEYRILSRMGDVLFELSDALIQAGIDVYQIDHEDANGQFEVNFTYADALATADDLIFVKMAASEIANKHGMICSFMPKPFANRTGSGMHMHMSLGDGTRNAFLDKSDSNGLGLSKLAYHFLAGLLQHASALTAIACPSVNSYKRLVSGGSLSGATWAPISICYGDNNRTAMVRVPYGRLEYRTPDPATNPYLLTAAVAAAGLDGIERKLDAGPPTNLNLYQMTEDEKQARGIARLPRDLRASLLALEDDAVLVEALGENLVREFLALKWAEVAAYDRHVSAWEVERYLEFY